MIFTITLALAAGCTARTDDAIVALEAPLNVESTRAGQPPPAFQHVRRGLYRGGQPSREALEYLKALGVRTILSLQQPDGSIIEGDSADEVAEEQENARALGLRWISVPMGSWSSKETYADNWASVEPLLANASGLYVHCKKGKDRTGLVIGLERVFIEGWAAPRAHEEMMALGHSGLLPKLDSYFWEATGETGED